jgi:hypothetical protein
VDRKVTGESAVVSQCEVLEYARECKCQCPQITEAELRAFLEAKFLRGIDPLAEAADCGLTLGLVRNPMDWLNGLSWILRGIARRLAGDEEGIKDIIDGVVRIVQEEPENPR